MTLRDLYIETLSSFKENRIDFPENEVRFLICELLGLTSSDFYLKSYLEISDKSVSLIEKAKLRRFSGEPLQYIIGSWDFMGRSFYVGEGVLIPRPETELLCLEIAKSLKNKTNPVIYDLCSGSGCIGITIQCEYPDADVYMLEKSDDAFKYLTANADRLCKDKNIKLLKGDVFDIKSFIDLPSADIIVSNPPYIKSSEVPTLQTEVTFEPKMALDGGEDGLVFYRYIISEWTKKLKPDGIMLFEIGEEQGDDLKYLFKNNGFDSLVIKDYNNHDRIVKARKEDNLCY